jgi:cellulose synthase/poly-beta-1,6-N-acetylglucosamine synthase-like glycosyltransferase
LQANFPVLKILQQPGNRSTGRNAGISAASNHIIAITDAGCVPQQNWLEQLVSVYLIKKPDVVAGYYRGRAETPFAEAVIPYALVMPDQIDAENFLPATRSMLLTKKIWQDAGGFDENLSDNEDFEFARRLRRVGAKIVFARQAVVDWLPRTSLGQFWQMIYRFARGDIFAGIIRPKVILIFVRYLLTAVILIFLPNLILASLLLLLYLLWTIAKNFRFVPRGWYWLPVLQVVSDAAVMLGSLAGALKLAGHSHKKSRIKKS